MAPLPQCASHVNHRPSTPLKNAPRPQRHTYLLGPPRCRPKSVARVLIRPSGGRDWGVAVESVLGPLGQAAGFWSIMGGAPGKVKLGIISETHSRSMLDSPSRCLILGLREIQTHRARKRFSVIIPNYNSPTAFCI